MAGPDWVTLTEGEEVVWSGRPSTVRVAEELVGETLLVALGVALAFAPVQAYLPASVPFEVPELGYYPLALAAIGLLLAFATYVRFKVIGYVVTNRELYKKTGLVSREVTTMRLDRVQDHGYQQTAGQRILGYGDVFVSTAGSGGRDLVFENAPSPDAVAASISEQLEAVRQRRRNPVPAQ